MVILAYPSRHKLQLEENVTLVNHAGYIFHNINVHTNPIKS